MGPNVPQGPTTEIVAAELRVRAEREIGKKLKETVKAGNPQLSPDGTIGLLPDGVSRNQSSRYQRMADIPDEKANPGRP